MINVINQFILNKKKFKKEINGFIPLEWSRAGIVIV